VSVDLVLLVPVLNRPHRVAPFLGAVESSTPGARVLFLADGDDEATLEAIEKEVDRDLCIDLNTDGGRYSEKCNRGVGLTSETLIFTAADDLEPRVGWFEAALASMVDSTEVVGINDLIDRPRRPEHATHFLLTRRYAEQPTIDGGSGPFHTGYVHWYCDDEMVATARHRGVYAYAAAAEIDHLHPMVNLAPDDAVYAKGRENRRQDRRLFTKRSALWT
jgi:hypothetical protein